MGGKKKITTKVNSVCKYCKTEFYRRKSPKPKFCSVECSKAAVREATEKIKLTCATCNSEFERTAARVHRSKHGVYFCTRICKDLAQRLNGDKRIHPEHYYQNSGTTYSVKAKRFLDLKCADCGVNHPSMLEVHHMDGDRSNNVISNLEVVCPNHHRLRHMHLTEAGWVYGTTKLTPRDKLEELRIEFKL